MRQRVLTIGLISLSIIALPSTSQAIQAGDVCKKAGAVKKSGGKTFTCVKKGKKLVWRIQSSSAQAAASIPTNSPSPTTSPTPSPTPTLTRTPTPSPTPTPTPTPAPQKLTALQELYKTISDGVAEYSVPKGNITKITSPKVRSSRVIEIHGKYEAALARFGSQVKQEVTMIFFDETEKDWWRSQVQALEGSNGDFSWWDSGHCPVNPNQICGYGNQGNGKSLFYHLVGSNSSWQDWHQFVVDHEAVHMAQLGNWKNSHPNCWIGEGYANALGYAMYQGDHEFVRKERQNQWERINSLYPDFRSFSISRWEQVWDEVGASNSKCFSAGFGYSYGMLVVESLYKEFGFKKVQDFLLDFSASQNFNDSSTRKLGMSEVDIRRIASTYVYNTIKTN